MSQARPLAQTDHIAQLWRSFVLTLLRRQFVFGIACGLALNAVTEPNRL